MNKRCVLLVRAAAVLVAATVCVLWNRASVMMDGAYARDLARCPVLPEKYVPESIWMLAYPPLVLAMLMAFLAFALVRGTPRFSIGLLGVALIGFGAVGWVFHAGLTYPCPTLF
ncbi:hypothetical protein [Brevundimonas sp.]